MDRTDPSEDLARVQRSDPAQLGQGGAGYGDRCLDVAGGLGDPPVQLPNLTN
ncbi:hypothetical protein [Rhodococcus sp. WAY2]|uniref:hypothetical protein n=1 Tax=Rhodococcus sp. WAY2 TaxID=2663121 RepID=UPI001F2926DB|nr:hypothetical protein [Rhodococcus sp. WAY2]